MTRYALVLLLSLALNGREARADEHPQQTEMPRRFPSVRVYNPTAWDGPVVVEVPVGHLATPGLIDWATVRLVAEDGSEVAHAIREGRPHWKASLIAPIEQPRAEDLLTFSTTVKPDTWARFRWVSNVGGVRHDVPALAERDGRFVVSYPGLEAIVAADTGMLEQITALGEPLLKGPLAITFSQSSAPSPESKPLPAPRVALSGRWSNAALTVLHFVLTVDDQLSMAVSYYFHASRAIEIWIDERPWQQTSPWVDRKAVIDWPVKGEVETLPFLENRAPFYGFKDYAAAVRHVAAVHRFEKAAVVELGEETTNGRRWMRRLFCLPRDHTDHIPALVEAADEGMIVGAEPMDLILPDRDMQITHPPGEHSAAERLGEVWRAKGMPVKVVVAGSDESDGQQTAVAFRLAAPTETPGIEGDGFEIRPDSDGHRVTVTAHSRFGLLQAARHMAQYAATSDAPIGIPLTASNPAVSLRAGGFGGGDFEVDFPHGSDAQWDDALEGLAASGMNVMADLGMWSNWKMPVSYRYMPELQSSNPDAYDEVSGAKLSELELHRQRGLRLLQFLHDRGVKVWLWLPVGCVPTTYAQQHPEAMAPGKPACPCFTHPLYNRYLESFLTELLETYAIDGIVMIRDDNGGLCPCQRCKEYVAQSATKNAAWEQYLILYRWLRGRDFRGDVAVYPYWDYYEPRLDPVLPADLLVVGHGSGATVLARNYERSLPMGDTWLDNVFASFRVASTPRMRRLLADRNAFWIGGALRGSELPWQSIGRFGWEPTATVNSFRFEWATQQFGAQRALPAVALIDTYEELWELYDLPMLPHEWMKLSTHQRQATSERGQQLLEEFRRRLAILRADASSATQDAWLRQVDLFGVYFEYLLRRLELFAKMHELAVQHKPTVEQGGQLAEPLRQELLSAHREIYAIAERYDAQAAEVPGNMLARTRAAGLTRPFKEFVAGYDPSLDGVLQIKQFAGTVAAVPDPLSAGKPFVLRIRVRNLGVCPWMEGVGHQLELHGDTASLGLPATWDFAGPPMVLGDEREIVLRGVAPRESGEASIRIRFTAPFRNVYAIAESDVVLRWK